MQTLKSPQIVRKLAAAAASLACGSALWISAPANANANAQDWAMVDVQTQHIASALGRAAAPIDRRIKLAKCPETPAITAMDSNSLAVRCATLGWRLRVAMVAPAGSMGDNSGSVLFGAPAAPTRRAASSPPVIKRGDLVRISIDTPHYSVSHPAIATQDGRMGEAISLRGADPKNPILAVVTGPGRASISR